MMYGRIRITRRACWTLSKPSGDTGEHVRSDYAGVCENLKHRGASLAIIACTELSALGGDLPIDCVDAAEILATEIVQFSDRRYGP